VRTSITSLPIRKLEQSSSFAPLAQQDSVQDFVSVEEPLQIRLRTHDARTQVQNQSFQNQSFQNQGSNERDRDIAITMRTPGHDRELAAGFLFTEGVLQHAGQVSEITSDGRGAVTICLAEELPAEIASRNFYVTSSCGVCGKASVEALRQAGIASPPLSTPMIHRDTLFELPQKLRKAQAVFEHTGGLHGAGLFTASGELLLAREDVGRHNAVDKLIGSAFLENRLPLGENVLMLSGRISFELVQKALMAGIPIVAAVGAPSSLAVETALRFGITLVGFLRDGRGNVYSGHARVQD
jgi:FdhD protein